MIPLNFVPTLLHKIIQTAALSRVKEVTPRTVEHLTASDPKQSSTSSRAELTWRFRRLGGRRLPARPWILSIDNRGVRTQLRTRVNDTAVIHLFSRHTFSEGSAE